MSAALKQTRRLVYIPRKPGRIWQVLATFANSPAGLTSKRAADLLMPPAQPHRHRTETAARRALRERLGIQAGEGCPESRQRLRKRLREQVSRDIRKLTGLGYLSGAVGPRLDPVELALFRSHGWEAFRRLRHVVDADGDIVGRALEAPTLRGRFRRSIVETLAEHPEGMTTDALLLASDGYAPSGRERGTWRAAMSELEECGTVIPGRTRFVTALGLSRLEMR